MRLEDIKRCLAEAATEAAVSAVEAPGDRTEFAYGHAVGYYAGLREAAEVVIAMVADKHSREFDL